MKYRYREPHEMKDSRVEWLGMIPKEWEVKKIKYYFNFFRGLPITKLDLKTEGIACLNYGEIHSKYPFLINSNSNELQKVSEKYLETNRNSLLKYGDFVFADTSEDLKGSGNFTFIEGNGQIFAGYHTITMRCKMNYLKKYLAYLFESINIRKQIQSKVKGVKVYSITQNILKDIDILISVDEKKIADFLDKKCEEFDSVIAKKEMLINKLEEAKKSLISEVVTGKVKVIEKENGEYGIIKREAHEMKDSGVEWLGMIPKEWEVKKIKYCFNFFRGLPITKLDLKTEGIACLNYGEIHSKYPFLINSNSNELQKVSEKYLETNKNSLLKYGDFVFADTSEDLKGSGNFTFIEGDGQIFAGYHTITMRCKMSYFKKYLAYLFESTNIRKQIQSKVKGVKVYSITQNILKDIDILISVDEKEIAKFLDEKCSQFDIAIEKQKESIEKLKSAKKSLISETVTGKIEVL